MKVLLTGGAGYIGANTAVEVLNSGHQVVIADNFINSSPDVIKKISLITGKPVKLFKTDITDRKNLRRLFRICQFDAVMHFAALKGVGESVTEPLNYYHNNLDGLLAVLEIMEEFGVDTIIYSSSATVYGEENPAPCSEEMPVGRCSSPYGWTKLMSEQILRDAAKARPEMSVMLLRYFNPAGGHSSGLLGEHPMGTPNNLMPYLLEVAEGNLDKLHVFGDDYPTRDGTGIRDYIHVTDLARGHMSALKYALEHRGVETVNLGTGHGTSVLELIKTFEATNGIPVPYIIDQRRPGDIAECWAAVNKAEWLLGWKAEKGLDDICRDSWNSRYKQSD